MAIEVGNILDGTISGITNFGAFVDLGNQHTGLVHISEVSHEYVKDIKSHFTVQDKVKVKVLSLDNGKISLSIKQAQPKPETVAEKPKTNMEEKRDFSPKRVFKDRKSDFSTKSNGMSFEDKMKLFMRDSEERLADLKRNTESKRGGRGGRRD